MNQHCWKPLSLKSSFITVQSVQFSGQWRANSKRKRINGLHWCIMLSSLKTHGLLLNFINLLGRRHKYMMRWSLVNKQSWRWCFWRPLGLHNAYDVARSLRELEQTNNFLAVSIFIFLICPRQWQHLCDELVILFLYPHPPKLAHYAKTFCGMSSLRKLITIPFLFFNESGFSIHSIICGCIYL